MRRNTLFLICLLPFLSRPAAAQIVTPLGSGFTYQGRLIQEGNAANGLFDTRFTLHGAATGIEAEIGNPIELTGVTVSNGLFAVEMDFGAAAFDGFDRWLEIGVRPAAAGQDPYVTLAPRQRISATPYAVNAANLMNGGNEPLEIRVGARRALRIEPGSGSTFNMVGGYAQNSVEPNVTGAVIAGGGFADGSEGNYPNRVFGDFGVIGGGYGNRIEGELGVIAGGRNNDIQGSIGATISGGTSHVVGSQSSNATIGGGANNTVDGDGATIGGGVGNEIDSASRFSVIGGGATNYMYDSQFATIAGGYNNQLNSDCRFSTIGGGQHNEMGNTVEAGTIAGGANNFIEGSAGFATISGGSANTIEDGSPYAVIGGGEQNLIGDSANGATIAGGSRNRIGDRNGDNLNDGATISGGADNAIGDYSSLSTIAGGGRNGIGTNCVGSVISGGLSNWISNHSSWATIPGGEGNYAAHRAFAAGSFARAEHTGAYVWADSSLGSIASTNADSVTMRANGGYRLYSHGNLTVGVFLPPGGGAWTAMSDRNAKENIKPVSPRAVLEKVAGLAVTTWNYKTQQRSVRHIGPMAQDFKAAFGVGESDTGITSVDADGVALAAIQGLNEKVEEQHGTLKQRETEIAELKRRLDELESLLLKSRQP
jgi:trimeric autotransporter adhesin